MSENTYYITTAIDYVNAAPHLGHAYEKIATDVMARFQRLCGKEAFFLTGTDEHGIKVQKTAEGKGVTPKAHCDETAKEFVKAWEYLGITYNRFIRTTDEDHYALVAKMWNTLKDKGLIEKRSYEGLYCPGCEAFKTKRDLTEDGECANHQRKPDIVVEENYFFLITKFKDQIAAHIKANPTFVQPKYRADEVLGMLEDLQDISVSRPKTTVSWGIPVPGDDEQVIYVWIDALSNYITGIGCWKDQELFNKYWGTTENPNAVHVIGKDILRFHAIYWPAMLLAADLPLYKTLFVHGFINLNDSKISKSVGNVVSPFDLARRFDLPNPDPIRYYLMKVAKFGYDGNFTEDDFKNVVNADLANNLGNLLNRTLNMAKKYFDGKVPERPQIVRGNECYFQPFQTTIEESETFPLRPRVVEQGDDLILEQPVAELRTTNLDDYGKLERVKRLYSEFNFQEVCNEVLVEIDEANKFISDLKPWDLAKNNLTDQLASVIYSVLDLMRQCALVLSPITPALSTNILEQLGYSGNIEDARWEHITETSLPAGQLVNLGQPILPRLDSELAGAAKKAGK